MYEQDELAAILKFGAEDLFKEDEGTKNERQHQLLAEDIDAILARAEVCFLLPSRACPKLDHAAWPRTAWKAAGCIKSVPIWNCSWTQIIRSLCCMLLPNWVNERQGTWG